MPPHWEHAGPRSRPISFAGRTGGESVIASAAALVVAGAGALRRAPPVPALGPGRAPGGAARRARRGVLRRPARADLRRQDAQVLLGVGVEEARGEPAH